VIAREITGGTKGPVGWRRGRAQRHLGQRLTISRGPSRRARWAYAGSGARVDDRFRGGRSRPLTASPRRIYRARCSRGCAQRRGGTENMSSPDFKADHPTWQETFVGRLFPMLWRAASAPDISVPPVREERPSPSCQPTSHAVPGRRGLSPARAAARTMRNRSFCDRANSVRCCGSRRSRTGSPSSTSPDDQRCGFQAQSMRRPRTSATAEGGQWDLRRGRLPRCASSACRDRRRGHRHDRSRCAHRQDSSRDVILFR